MTDTPKTRREPQPRCPESGKIWNNIEPYAACPECDRMLRATRTSRGRITETTTYRTPEHKRKN